MAHTVPKNSTGGGLRRAIEWAIIVLVLALAFLLLLLVRDYRSLRRAQVINARELWLSAALRNHGHLTASDVTMVRSWMTFDYVNRLFDLPPDFLKTELSITDARYPQLSLSSYARSKQVNSAAVVGDVENAIRIFFATATPAVSSSTGIGPAI